MKVDGSGMTAGPSLAEYNPTEDRPGTRPGPWEASVRQVHSRNGLQALLGILLGVALVLAWSGAAGAVTIDLGDVTLGQTFISGNARLEFRQFSFDSFEVDPADITLGEFPLPPSPFFGRERVLTTLHAFDVEECASTRVPCAP